MPNEPLPQAQDPGPSPQTRKVLRIALPRPVRQFFDYTCDCAAPALPGQRVRVLFGRQPLIGIIVAVDPDDTPDIRLRPISSLLDQSPLLPPSTLALIDWAARYYQHPPGECLWAALPPSLRKGGEAVAATEIAWSVAPGAASDTLPKRAVRQHELLRWLQDQPGEHANGTLTAAGFSTQVIKGLAERSLLQRHERPLARRLDAGVPLQSLPTLNPAQQTVLDKLPIGCDHFAVHLIHGITGSGKTEVYMHWLKRSLGEHRQALILVPEINLTPQTVARFVRHFGARVALWHSALSDSERLQAWLRVQSGEPVILVGTRSGILLPYCNLGAIVVDEEHDGSYKQNEGFRYSARDLSLVAAQQAVETTLARGQQVLLFINRRGFAPVLMCYDCGYLLECPNCDTRLTLHRREGRMRCHHCDYQRPVPRQCDKCHSDNLNPVGEGTEKTEEVLTQALPDFPVIRIDRDSTRQKGSLDGMLAAVRQGNPCVLVGTQMLTKGHDFPGVTLVGVLNADGGLFSNDFRGPENLAQTVTQVAGRAGRGDIPGQVLIQTCHSDHPMLQKLCQHDYLSVARGLLQEREDALLPPCSSQIAVRFETPDMQQSLDRLTASRKQLEAWLEEMPGLMVMGPFPAVIARKANRHRAYLILQADDRRCLQRAASALTRWLESCRLSRNERWLVDVDPQELD